MNSSQLVHSTVQNTDLPSLALKVSTNTKSRGRGLKELGVAYVSGRSGVTALLGDEPAAAAANSWPLADSAHRSRVENASTAAPSSEAG